MSSEGRKAPVELSDMSGERVGIGIFNSLQPVHEGAAGLAGRARERPAAAWQPAGTHECLETWGPYRGIC